MYRRKRFCLPKDDATIKRWNLKYLANDARKTEKEKWHTRFNLASFQTAQHATPFMNDFTIIFTICIQCSHSAVLCDDVQLVLLHLVSRAYQLLLSDSLLYMILKVSIYRCCPSPLPSSLRQYFECLLNVSVNSFVSWSVGSDLMIFKNAISQNRCIHIGNKTHWLPDSWTERKIYWSQCKACFSVYSLCTYQRACAHVCCVRVCIFERLCLYIRQSERKRSRGTNKVFQ